MEGQNIENKEKGGKKPKGNNGNSEGQAAAQSQQQPRQQQKQQKQPKPQQNTETSATSSGAATIANEPETTEQRAVQVSHQQQQQQPQQQQQRKSNNNPVNPAQATPTTTPQPRLALFNHLPKKTQINSGKIEGSQNIHSSIIRLGQLFRNGQVYEDDDRVAALLATFLDVVGDYRTPPNKSLIWELDKYVKAQVQYLVDCRQHSIGMGNLIKYFRYTITQVPPNLSESDAKQYLHQQLVNFFEERIAYSREAIVDNITSTIRENDVVMTFGTSPLLRQVLLGAAGVKRYQLIVVDCRPLNEGLRTLELLSPHITCTYTPLSGAAALMKDVSKVIVGASGIMSNGTMLAPAGTAMVASLAKAANVPVIVACETYKFCEKVQLDSIVFNELGATTEVVILTSSSPEYGEKSSAVTNLTPSPQLESGYRGAADLSEDPQLPFQIINLRYDLTPIHNISAIATETGLIPPTSVPVLIRELRQEINN